MEALFIVLVVVVAAAILYAVVQAPIKRRRELAAVAFSMGLQYSQEDPFGMLRLPFPLFRKGDGRGVESLIWGAHRDQELWEFDYWYYVESTNNKGMRSKTYHRYSCCLAELPMRAPHTEIGPETILTRLADAIGLRDIDFESEEFNRKMQVKSQDRRFATYLVDARMMQWLLDTRGWSFELFDRYLLCIRDRMRPSEIPLILDAVAGFRETMPAVVFETYGS